MPSKNVLLAVFSFVLFAGFTKPAMAAKAECSSIFAPAFDKTVQVMWYPRSAVAVLTHVEFAVDGVVWRADGNYRSSGSIVINEKAARTKRGYVSFQLKVSGAELEKMKAYISERENQTRFQTCISGACSVITKNTGIIIPFAISQVPTLTAAYLAVMSKLGYQRVAKMEWVGKKKLERFLTLGILWEVVLSSTVLTYAANAVMGLVITGYDSTHHVLQHLIPIVSP